MHRQKSSKKKPILFTLLGIVIVIVLCLVFFVPLNNGLRSATGQDTPTDKIIKSELAKKITANKTGNAQHDAAVEQAANKLQDTKMSTIMKSANNEQDAAKLIQQTSTLSPAQSQKAAHEIFTNDKFTPLRNAMGSGNWVQTYQQYRQLSGNGSLTELKQAVAN